MVRRFFFFIAIIAVLMTACTDNDSFTVSTGARLSFSEDTIRFDTLFSTVPSATQTFWVRNESSDGIRILTARLERNNQSGYRVNVDGTYLDPVGSDFEVRKGDSILVFVEVTTRENRLEEPQLVEDNLIFTLESGVEQRVNLRTYSWDAQKLTDLVIRQDTVIESRVPIIVYGQGIRVEQGAVWMEEANCRDGLCIHQGKMRNRAKSIVCLPHNLVITLEGDSGAGETEPEDLDVIIY